MGVGSAVGRVEFHLLTSFVLRLFTIAVGGLAMRSVVRLAAEALCNDLTTRRRRKASQQHVSKPRRNGVLKSSRRINNRSPFRSGILRFRRPLYELNEPFSKRFDKALNSDENAIAL